MRFGYMKYHASMATNYATLKNGVYVQKSHLSAATHHRVLNLVPNLPLDIPVLFRDEYANDLISIFMNINENFRDERKNLRKIKGCTYKITNGLPVTCYSVSNLMPNQCLDIVLLP